MENINLVKGLVGRWNDSEVEFVRAIDLKFIQVKSLGTGGLEIISVGDFLAIPDQRYYEVRSQALDWLDEDSDISEEKKDAARKRYEVLVRVWYSDKTRADKIIEIKALLGISTALAARSVSAADQATLLICHHAVHRLLLAALRPSRTTQDSRCA